MQTNRKHQSIAGVYRLGVYIGGLPYDRLDPSRTLRTDRSSSLMLKGLLTYPLAPDSSVARVCPLTEKPLAMSTLCLRINPQQLFKTFLPPIAGIMRSRITKAISFFRFRKRSAHSRPLSAVITEYPAPESNLAGQFSDEFLIVRHEYSFRSTHAVS